jgi:hypothetical protein
MGRRSHESEEEEEGEGVIVTRRMGGGRRGEGRALLSRNPIQHYKHYLIMMSIESAALKIKGVSHSSHTTST